MRSVALSIVVLACAPAVVAGQDLYLAGGEQDFNGYYCEDGPPGTCGAVLRWSAGTQSIALTVNNEVQGSLVACAGDNGGTAYALTELSGYALHTFLMRGQQIVGAFPGLPGDVHVGPDGAVYVALRSISDSEYGGFCNEYSAECGAVYRWTPAGGAEKILTLHPHDGVGTVMSVAVDANGRVLVLTANDPYYGVGDLGGVLLVDGVPALSFDQTPVDVDVAADGSVYIGVVRSEYACSYESLGCGEVLRWTIGGPAPQSVLVLPDGSKGALTGVAAIDATTFYASTASLDPYDNSGRLLDTGGNVLATFDRDIMDVDAGVNAPPPSAPPGVKVFLGNAGNVYACAYENEFCPTVSTWDASAGAVELATVELAYNNTLVAVAADVAGHQYAVTAAYYYSRPEQGHLQVDGVDVAAFSQQPVDVEVAPDGRVYVATQGNEEECAQSGNCGHVYLWLDGAGPVEVASLDTDLYGWVTSMAVDAAGNIYLGTGDDYGYGPRCHLLRNGVSVATFDLASVADVDVATDGTVYFATENGGYYTDCYQGGAQCGGVWKWTEAGGAELLFELDSDEWGVVTSVAADGEGHWYLAAAATYGSDKSVLFRDGHAVAGFVGEIVDVDAMNFPLDPPPTGFTNLGYGCAGTTGTPLLTGLGSLEGGTIATLLLTGGAPNATAALVLGTGPGAGSFKACPFPVNPIAIVSVLTDHGGRLLLAGHAPYGIPPGTEVLFHVFVEDAGAAQGWSSSNVLKGTFP